MAKSKSPSVSTAEKTLIAVEMKRDCKSYEAIGQALGCNRSYAFKLVHKELKRLADETSQNTKELIVLENQRLDYLQEKLGDRIEAGDLSAINTYLRISERRARLNGLDGAQKIEHSGGVAITLHMEDCSKRGEA